MDYFSPPAFYLVRGGASAAEPGPDATAAFFSYEVVERVVSAPVSETAQLAEAILYGAGTCREGRVIFDSLLSPMDSQWESAETFRERVQQLTVLMRTRTHFPTVYVCPTDVLEEIIGTASPIEPMGILAVNLSKDGLEIVPRFYEIFGDKPC